VISSGHGKKIRGAAGSPIPPCCDEVDEARKVTEAVATALRKRGATVTTLHDDVSTSQSANLSWITSHHNSQPAHDIDISTHFNCYDGNAHGCEVLYVSSLGEERARKIVDAICKVSGLTNRGPKKRTDLAFLNNTNTPGSVLLEIAFCDNPSDCSKYRENFDAICDAVAAAVVGEEVQPGPTPPPIQRPERPESVPPTPPTPAGHPQLSEGSEGPAVVELQRVLAVTPADGDFGNITATQVESFQAACGLTPDGVVGKNTWAAVDDLEERMEEGEKGLSEDLIAEIVAMAQASPIDDYEWPDRGISPPGYIAGMALCYAIAVQSLILNASHAKAMAKPLGSSDVDALKHYEAELRQKGCKLDTPEDRLRSLFVLKIGAAMRESSGRYCEGRDLSASNVQADTAEAGIEQASWNVRSADPSLPGLLDEFWQNPNGFRFEFAENVEPTAENLDVYGSGEGARYQFLAKFCPLFAVFVSGVALRTRKDHFGPVKRKEVTIKKEADDLLKQVQALINTSV
jgi:hypothetical protein